MHGSTINTAIHHGKGPGASERAIGRSSLKALAIRGAAWTVGGFAGSQLLRMLSNIVLAWLLVPEAFGLMLLVNMMMQGLQMFSDIGLGPSIIQNANGHSAAFLNTAWTIQIIRGFVLWLAACLLAWPLAWLFAQNDPLAWQLVYLVPVAGFMAVISGFFSTRLYTLNRNLAMGRFTAIQTASQATGVVTMISWALIAPSVWALVAGGLAAYVCKLILSHTLIDGPRSRLAWNTEAVRSLFKLGKWIFLSTAIAYLALQADRILLGNFVPLEVLGVYGFALMVATLPREVLVHLTGMVLFPALSEHGRTNRHSLPEKIRIARSALLPVASTAVLAVALLAPIFFKLLYPAQYHDAGWMSQLISIPVWFTVLGAMSDRALLSIGNARALAAGNIANLLTTFPAALIGLVYLGVPGCILGYACGALANLVVIQRSMHIAGFAVFSQDVQFTLITFGLIVFGAAAPAMIQTSGDGLLQMQIITAAIMLSASSWWAWWAVWPVVKRTKA